MIARSLTAVLLLEFSLAACGGSGSTVTPAASNAGAGVNAEATATNAVRFVIPHAIAAGSSTARSVQFVSPSSASMKVTINSIAGDTTIPSTILNPQVTNLTTTGAGAPCTISGNVETCTVPIPMPTGATSYTFDLYDGQNATGNHLAIGTQTITNVPGANPAVTASLSGIVASVAVGATPSLALDTAGSALLSIVPEDADGNPITGSATYGNGVLTISDNDTSGTTGLTTGAPATSGIGNSSVTVASGAQDVIYLNYSGAPSSDPNFTIGSSFSSTPAITNAPESVQLAPFSQTRSSQYIAGQPIVFPTAGGFGGTMVPTASGATPGTVEAQTTSVAPGEGAPPADGSAQTLVYYELTFDTSEDFVGVSGPTFTFNATVPTGAAVMGTNFYLAYYDLSAAPMGWNQVSIGPAQAVGTNIAFTLACAAQFEFISNESGALALLAVPPGGIAPTSLARAKPEGWGC